MIRIAIVTREMITGGVEKALIGMLRHVDYSQAEVDLYVSKLGGELEQDIPKEVTVKKTEPLSLSFCLTHPAFLFRKVWNRLQLFRKLSYATQCYYSSKLLKPIQGTYDIAISYHAPNTVPVFFTMDGLQADKKILWLHGELEANEGQNPKVKEYHSRYDQICAVSSDILASFDRLHPEKAGCGMVFHNYVDRSDILAKAEIAPSFLDDFQGIRLVSVGRLSYEKGFDMAVEVCRRLVDQGFDIRWYICGEGESRKSLEALIEEKELTERVLLLGNQPNPYGYIKNCDLYVQTSRTEGYGLAMTEARALKKPVITTAVSGAREQFVHGGNGWMTEISADGIYDQIVYCLQHPKEVEEMETRIAPIELNAEDPWERIVGGLDQCR